MTNVILLKQLLVKYYIITFFLVKQLLNIKNFFFRFQSTKNKLQINSKDVTKFYLQDFFFSLKCVRKKILS